MATYDDYHFYVVDTSEKDFHTSDKLTNFANSIYISCMTLSPINELLFIVDSKNQLNLYSYKTKEFIYRFQTNVPIINSIWAGEYYLEEILYVDILYGTSEGLFKSRLYLERLKKGYFNDKIQPNYYKHDFIKNKIERDQTWFNWQGLYCSTYYHKNILDCNNKYSFRLIIEYLNLGRVESWIDQVSNFNVQEKHNLIYAWNKEKSSILYLNKTDDSTKKKESIQYYKNKEFEQELIYLGGGVKFKLEEKNITFMTFLEPYIIIGTESGHLKYIYSRVTGELDKTKTLKPHEGRIVALCKYKLYKNCVISLSVDNMMAITQLDSDNTFYKLHTNLDVRDAILFKPKYILIKEAHAVKTCAFKFNYSTVIIYNPEDLRVKELIYKDEYIYVYLTSEDSLRVFDRKTNYLKSLVFGPPGNHKILSMRYVQKVDKLFVLYEYGLLTIFNVSKETALISECLYLSKICDKNMVQINSYPNDFQLYYKEIPEIDLESVDEKVLNNEEYFKYFVETNTFDLDKKYKHMYILCSYNSGSIIGTNFYYPYKIKMRYNTLKGVISHFNTFMQDKMVQIVDNQTLKVIRVQLFSGNKEGKSKMEIESELVQIDYTYTLPHRISAVKISDNYIIVGTEEGYFDIIKYEADQNKYYLVEYDPMLKHEGPIQHIEVHQGLIITQSVDSVLHVWNFEKYLIKSWVYNFNLVGVLADLDNSNALFLVTETAFYRIDLNVPAQYYKYNNKFIKYVASDYFKVKEFLDRRNSLYSFSQNIKVNPVKYEPLIQSAIQQMDKSFDPLGKVSDHLNVEREVEKIERSINAYSGEYLKKTFDINETNIDTEFERIAKKVFENYNKKENGTSSGFNKNFKHEDDNRAIKDKIKDKLLEKLNLNDSKINNQKVINILKDIVKEKITKKKVVPHPKKKKTILLEDNDALNEEETEQPRKEPRSQTTKMKSKSMRQKYKLRMDSSESVENIISDQTSMLANWNQLKPYNDKTYMFLKATGQDHTKNLMYQQSQFVSKPTVEEMGEVSQKIEKNRVQRYGKAIPDYIMEANKYIHEAENRINKMKYLTRREMTTERINYNISNFGSPTAVDTMDLSLTPIAKIKIKSNNPLNLNDLSNTYI